MKTGSDRQAGGAGENGRGCSQTSVAGLHRLQQRCSGLIVVLGGETLAALIGRAVIFSQLRVQLWVRAVRWR